MMVTISGIITTIICSNAFTALVQHRLNKKNKNKEETALIRTTLSAVTYYTLSNELERLLSKGYATPDERKALQVLFEAYKANGWNGDMDTRMNKVYSLRTNAPKGASDGRS